MTVLNLRKKFQTYIRVIKRRTVGIEFGETWQGRDSEKWFNESVTQIPLVDKNFLEFLQQRDDIRSVLDIGCGPGIYPIKYKELFQNMTYTGIDISKSAIEYCKKYSNFEFICGDFLKTEINSKFDLIFSRSVIDHVYDIDLFLQKVIGLCKKYAYIYAYRGYYPELKEHKMIYSKNGGFYANSLSVNQLKRSLLNLNVSENEFIIRPQPSGHHNWKIGCVIEIERKV